MLAIVDVDLLTAIWTADPVNPDDKIEPTDKIRDHLRLAIEFQALRGGGEMFVPLPTT